MNYESKDDEANVKRRLILELYGETAKQDRFTFVRSYHLAGDKIHWRDFVVKQSMIPERVIDMLRARATWTGSGWPMKTCARSS